MNVKCILFFIMALFASGCMRNVKTTAAQPTTRMSVINDDAAETIFYFTKPKQERFPIAVLCDGSTSPNNIESVWRLHHFEQFVSLSELGVAILTVEKDGVDADRIDKARFFANYTRSRRFKDHVAIIDHLLKNPPPGFDGRLIFIGTSEGGPLVNQLSLHYPQAIATINWSGAGDWPWPDELWTWGEQMRKEHPFLARLYSWWHKIPRDRESFDNVMAETIRDPSDKRWFLGMTYRYHADAIKASAFAYSKIHAPMLVLCGTKDSLINSCDSFVAKARSADAPITYWRVEGMEHRISQNKENLIPKSFEWLKQLIANASEERN